MSTHVLERLDPSVRVLKRAQYEAFSFSLYRGDVLVRNESHADPLDHQYRVRVRDGRPVACECPADRFHDDPCKHRVAVAIRPPVLEAARLMQDLDRSCAGARVMESRPPSSST